MPTYRGQDSKSPQKLVKWMDHVDYFKTRECAFGYLENGRRLFSYFESGEEGMILILKCGRHII